LNIAEGNGKTAEADRRRYFEIARGSALACAAIQDVLVVGKALEEAESQSRKNELDRMAAMLSRLGGRAYQVGEQPAAYGGAEDDFDTDPDSDFDLEKRKLPLKEAAYRQVIQIWVVMPAARTSVNGIFLACLPRRIFCC
jgi:hypothetical protein